MKVTIDNAGRLVLPLSVREQLGIAQGGELEVRLTDDGVELRPATPLPRLAHEGRVLVYQPDESASEIDVETQIEATRST